MMFDQNGNFMLVRTGVTTIVGLVIVFALLFAGSFGCKAYERYQKRADSKNNLWKAQYDKKIQVEDATGKELAAKHLAEVEIARARGVAEANRIIAKSITPEYLRYFYINTLGHHKNQIIYVPTEAGLPILEAGHRP
jgi:hypothetical protein